MLTKVIIKILKVLIKKQKFDLTRAKSTILESTNCVDGCLKNSLIVGPNVSGKFNIIKAIKKF